MHHGKKNDKAKDFKGSMLKLIKHCKPYLPLIIVALCASMISSICSIIGPDKLKEMTDVITSGIITGIDLEKVAEIGLFLVILFTTSLVLSYLGSFIMVTVTNKFSKSLRSQISQKINRLPLKFFDNTTVGDILSRVTNDVDTIGQSLNESIGTLISASTMFIGSIIMMFITNWILAIVAILASVLGFGLMIFILGRSQKYFTRFQNQLGDINGVIEETFTGHNVIKAYNAEREVNQKFDRANHRLFDSARKSQFYSGLMQPIMNFIGNFGYVAVCVVGAALTMNGTISFGVIVAFIIYVRLFTQPLSQFAQSFTELQSTAAASERVFGFLDQPEMPSENHITTKLNPSEVRGDITFEKVNFGYDESRPIIKNFTADIKAGQKVAIVGPTGAGKTTIVNLLMRFYDIDSGDIKIDGTSIKNLTRENLHALFTMVLQDTWLFEGTIKENLRYNQQNITNEQIEKACKTVGVDHFIRTLPKNYDSILGDIDSLSAGEKQLLTIARATLKKSPFLILDEATSSVDTRTEELVQVAMDNLTKGRTSFIIAHRLSTIKNADLILVMKDGNIIEQGTHKKLLAKKGFYADLYNSQFAK